MPVASPSLRPQTTLENVSARINSALVQQKSNQRITAPRSSISSGVSGRATDRYNLRQKSAPQEKKIGDAAEQLLIEKKKQIVRACADGDMRETIFSAGKDGRKTQTSITPRLE